MTQNENPIIADVAREYSDYVAGGRRGKFVTSSKASDNLSKLSRLLEQKRQVGKLTQTEKVWLGQIGELMEKITRFNEDLTTGSEPQGLPVYDLQQRRRLEETQQQGVVTTPRISNQEAEKIIRGLDKQFEEKVMGRIRERRRESSTPSGEGESAPVQVLGAKDKKIGRNLQDYMTTIRAARPEVPFADDDSSFDLSKLIKSETPASTDDRRGGRSSERGHDRQAGGSNSDQPVTKV